MNLLIELRAGDDAGLPPEPLSAAAPAVMLIAPVATSNSHTPKPATSSASSRRSALCAN
jgi:hypothetical protein